MVPDVLIISTDVLNKLGDKERTALLKAADESMMQMKDVIWPAAEKEAYDKMKGITQQLLMLINPLSKNASNRYTMNSRRKMHNQPKP